MRVKEYYADRWLTRSTRQTFGNVSGLTGQGGPYMYIDWIGISTDGQTPTKYKLINNSAGPSSLISSGVSLSLLMIW